MRTRTLAAAVVMLGLAFVASLAYRRARELRNEAANYAKLEQGYAALGAEFRIGLRDGGNRHAKAEETEGSPTQKIADLLEARRALLHRCADMADHLREQFATTRKQYEAAARRPWLPEPQTADTEAEQAELTALARDANDLLLAATRLKPLKHAAPPPENEPADSPSAADHSLPNPAPGPKGDC